MPSYPFQTNSLFCRNMAVDENSSSQANDYLFDGYFNWVQTLDAVQSNNQASYVEDKHHNQTSDEDQTNWDWVPDESTSNWVPIESASNWVPDEVTSNQFQIVDENSIINWIWTTENDDNPFSIPEDPAAQSFYVKLRNDTFSNLWIKYHSLENERKKSRISSFDSVFFN